MMSARRRIYTWLHVLAGMAVGVLVLHPVTMVIYRFESGGFAGDGSQMLSSIGRTMLASFHPSMWPMGTYFASLGAMLGWAAGMFSKAVAQRDRRLEQQERQLEENVGALIREGESHRVEFKSSLRWDYRAARSNKELEEVVMKTLAGFMNAAGGTLLIGVADDTEILGLEADYGTLRRGTRDGFEQKIHELIANRIGTDACALSHVLFHSVEGKDVCRVYVEPSIRPIYVREGGASRYYLRTGNATRELDVQEAMQHIATPKKNPDGRSSHFSNRS